MEVSRSRCLHVCRKLRQYYSRVTTEYCRPYCVFKSPNPKIAIVGSGPAGFYTAQQIIKGHSEVEVDIYEKLPVPFGLVRFGVAPDHPEVKNVISTFTTTAKNSRCCFLGNVQVGRDISITDLKKAYTAVVLSYGADEDKQFNIEGEDLSGVLSARNFVGWYNGLPQDSELVPNLDTEVAVVLGQGNVALDVARVLLTPVDVLKKTDITQSALEALSKSRVKKVYLVGRRGPLQVAFTTAELREMVRLEGTRAALRPQDFQGLEKLVKDLPRPRRRLTELMIKSALDPDEKDKHRWDSADREWLLHFLRSPLYFLPDDSGETLAGVRLAVNRLEGDIGVNQWAVPTDQTEDIHCGLALRSIGYKSIPLEEGVPFDERRGIIPNKQGRVDGWPGLYCSGWVKRGPVGVIVSTMNDAFETGMVIVKDLKDGIIPTLNDHRGKTVINKILNERGIKPVSFEDWEKIDQYEIREGHLVGKPREKVTSIKPMLDIAAS